MDLSQNEAIMLWDVDMIAPNQLSFLQNTIDFKGIKDNEDD